MSESSYDSDHGGFMELPEEEGFVGKGFSAVT